MILGLHWPDFLFCMAIFFAGCWTLRNDFKPGGIFSSRPAPRDALAELFELPLPDGVEPYDVLATLDWIEAL